MLVPLDPMRKANCEGKVLSLWYDNFECASPLAVELIAVYKAITVAHNFQNKIMQVEIDYRMAMEALLSIVPILWRVCAMFKSVKHAFEATANIRL